MRAISAYRLAKKFAKKYTDNKFSQLPPSYKIKEAVATYDELPMSDNVAGDVRETLDTRHKYEWDGVQWNLFTEAIEVDDSLDITSENPVQNKIVKEALDDKQDKYVNVGSSTTVFVDSVEVPELSKIQFLEAYNGFLLGKTVLILDTLHNDAYVVNQASSKTYDATIELRFSINVHNSNFVDYVYDDATDEVTVESRFSAISASDKEYWDAKQDKSTITKTTSNDVVLTNNDTTVITQQLSSLTVGFDLPEDIEEDYVSSVIFKPYDVFVFQMDEPENYAVTWGGDSPIFESGSVYEVVYKILGIADPQGNTLISAKWSKVA